MERTIKRGDYVRFKGGEENDEYCPAMLVRFIALPSTIFNAAQNTTPRRASVMWFSSQDVLQQAEFDEDLLEVVG